MEPGYIFNRISSLKVVLAFPICYVLGQILFFSPSFLKVPLKASQYAIILVIHAAEVPRHGQQSENLLPSLRLGLPYRLNPAGAVTTDPAFPHRALNEDPSTPRSTRRTSTASARQSTSRGATSSGCGRGSCRSSGWAASSASRSTRAPSASTHSSTCTLSVSCRVPRS